MPPSCWDSPSLRMLKSYWNCAPIQGRPRDSGGQKVRARHRTDPSAYQKFSQGQSNQIESLGPPGRATEDSKRPQSETVAHSDMRSPGVPVANDALTYVLRVSLPSFSSS